MNHRDAYVSLQKDMENMQVSDLDYLEEPDIMNWSYLNIIDYRYMETEMRKHNMPNTSGPHLGFSNKGRVKEHVPEKLTQFNGDIADLIP